MDRPRANPLLTTRNPSGEHLLQGSGFRVQGAGLRVPGSGFRVQGTEFRVQGTEGLIVAVRRGVLEVPSNPEEKEGVLGYADP